MSPARPRRPPEPGPAVLRTRVVFRVSDAEHAVAGIRLYQEVRIPGQRLDFTPTAMGWELRVPRPAVDRMEYLLQLRAPDGGCHSIPDPANPLRAPGPFGDKSVVEFPEYSPPGWLTVPAPAGSVRELALPGRALGADVHALLYAGPTLTAGEPAPLLVVHDGPEYARFAGLTRFLDVMVGTGRLPPLRAALLAPVQRNEDYAASLTYARVLCLALVPALRAAAPVPAALGSRAVVAIGASLGAVAALHAHRRYPGTFGGLLLQSGSFFSPQLDPQEAGFSGFDRITRFVRDVLRSGPGGSSVPTVLTCGTLEENLPNNTHMSRSLGAQGYGAGLHLRRDVHTWTCWRDVLDPVLVDLLGEVWR